MRLEKALRIVNAGVNLAFLVAIGAFALLVVVACCFGEDSRDFPPTGIYAATQNAFPVTGRYSEQKPVVQLGPVKPVIAHENYGVYQPWFVNGQNTPDSHLINDHGVNPAMLSGLSQDEKNRLHGKMHGEKAVVSRVIPIVRMQTQSGGCPGGVCPIQFRRR